MRCTYLEFKVEIDTSTRLVRVPVSVNGDGPFEFDLDTGASTTTLSKKLAEQLEIQTRESNRPEARGIGGGIPTKYADVSVSVGPLEFDKDEVYVLDLDAVLQSACNRNGVLGYTTLKHCTMSLSYNKQRFKLTKGNSSLDLKWSPYVYIKDSHLVGVPVHINGKGPYDFVLDTGAGNTVVTPELASALSLDVKPVEGIARGVGGDVQLELAAVDELSVGTAKITNGQVVVIDLSKVSPKGGLIENGIIGYDFLKNFETVIDYPKQRFSFIDDRSS
jgi:predicted aspartyl protease